MHSRVIVDFMVNTVSTKCTFMSSIRSLSLCHKNINKNSFRTVSISPNRQTLWPSKLKLLKNHEQIVIRHFQTNASSSCYSGKQTEHSYSKGSPTDELSMAQLKKDDKIPEKTAKEDPDAQQEEERKRTAKALKFSIYTISGMIIMGVGSAIMIWGEYTVFHRSEYVANIPDNSLMNNF